MIKNHYHTEKNIAYIALGSNLDNPREQVILALDTLSKSKNIQLTAQSSLYQSKPVGPQDQNDFINAVCKITTGLPPLKLLDKLQKIEKQQGRIRKNVQWGPRTLDLDLLLYNNEVLETTRLTLPHYAMRERNFVLIPLQEISPNLVMPDGTQVKDLIKMIDQQGIIKLC